MKRAAEVKRSVRCSEEPMAGDGSMCAALSVTKRSPPKLLAADGTMRGVGVTKKRPRKADKPSKKEERSEEEKKRKRSKKKKKRAEEERTEKIASELEKPAAGDGFIHIKKKKKRTKKPKGGEVMAETVADDNAACGMTKLSQELLDYLRTKEVMGLLATEAPLSLSASKMAVGLFDLDQRLKEEVAAEFHENREFDAHVLYQYRTNGFAYAEIIKETETEEENQRRPNQQQNQVQQEVKYVSMEEQGMTELAEKSKKKKKLVTHEINKATFLSKEVWNYVMSIGVYTLEDCVISEVEMKDNLSTEDLRLTLRQRCVENQASLLRQYRTNGHAVLQYELTDAEMDMQGCGICVHLLEAVLRS